MNWEAIGAIGELLGATVVFITLLYLALQIRHSTRAMRSQSLNAQTEQMLAMEQIASQPSMIEPLKSCYIENEEDLSGEDAGLMEPYLISFLLIARNQFLHKQEGLDSDWEVIARRLPAYFSAKWPQRWWKEFGHRNFEPAFAEEVDRIIAASSDNDNYWVGYGRDSGDA